MKFKVLPRDWTNAISLVSSITPSSVDAQGSSGYLCVVQGEKCYVYSEDGSQRFRVPIPIFDVDDEGAFVFPTGPQGDLRYVDGWVEFEAVEEGGAHLIRCRRDTMGTRGGVHKIVTFSPAALKSLDSDFNKAEKTASFPVALLREALNMTKPYLADPKDANSKPEHVNLQLFGKDADKGNGYMLGSSPNKTCYFYSPDLEDRSLFVFGPRIPLLLSFLSKSTGDVTVHNSENSTYFMNSMEQVLGWSNQAYAGTKFGFYGTSLDRHIFRISKVALEKELKYIRSALPADKNKAFCTYQHADETLGFAASSPVGGEIESLPVKVLPLKEGDDGCWGPGDLGKKEDIQFNINLDWMIQLVDATKHPRDVILGIARAPKKQSQFYFRVIEEYSIDEHGKYAEHPLPDQKVYACRTLRSVPSKQ